MAFSMFARQMPVSVSILGKGGFLGPQVFTLELFPVGRRYTQNPDKCPPRWLESVDERFTPEIVN
jgi:hypothetical protein